MITDHKFFAKIIKNYFKNSTFNNSNNHNYYLTPFDTTPGLVKLHTLQKKKISYMAKYSSLIKNFTAASRLSNFELINKNNINDYNTIVLTWGRCNNFSDNGDYFDSCFNESSKNYKKILWFVVSLDNKVPKKINTNIVLLKNKNPELINFKHLIKLIIKKILTFFYKKNLNQFSFLEQFSIIVWENINNFVDVTKLKKIITPYEGQPFQNYINYKLKLNNKNINTIGYVHATQGFPIHLFRRDGAPNKLYVHGSDQKHHLINFLGWNKDQVQLISSLKFRKKDKKKFQNIIFLPYVIHDINFYLSSLEYLFNIEKKRLSTRLKIKIHPLKAKKKIQLKLKNKIKLLLKKYKLNKDLKYCNPIVLGASSVILEALENSLEPYHVYSNYTLERYSNDLWPSIESKTILENKICMYKLKEKNKCINIDAKKKKIF